MPLSLDAVFVSVPHDALSVAVVTGSFGSGWAQVSGVTANYPLYIRTAGMVTQGFAVSDADGNALIPFSSKDVPYRWHESNGYFYIWLITTSGVTVLTSPPLSFQEINPTYGYYGGEHANIGSWSFTQNSARDVTAQITSYQSVATYTVFESYDSGALEAPSFFKVWEVKMYGPGGALLATNDVTMRPDGQQPFTVFPASTVATTGEYFFSVARKTRWNQQLATRHIEGTFSTVLTAPAVTSGGNNMFAWLNNDYWYLTDLQVNLGTRAVTHRHGTVEIKPNDTVNFAVLFHDGSAGVNPQATDIKLAVRSSANTSAYHFWSAASVTTASVSGDVYYTITVTASDEDLLAAQAAGLLAGSNTSQTLLAEVQWTTTRGTFSSDTFTISVPNEVVREPDV